ncbi:MAG: hypothetical protein KatS3mg102_0939 [Planctomycetota bacterium]|nr:MAG: hypothetical protein KatS3mg102_0939 [Planctomycetota bacterium]
MQRSPRSFRTLAAQPSSRRQGRGRSALARALCSPSPHRRFSSPSPHRGEGRGEGARRAAPALFPSPSPQPSPPQAGEEGVQRSTGSFRTLAAQPSSRRQGRGRSALARVLCSPSPHRRFSSPSPHRGEGRGEGARRAAPALFPSPSPQPSPPQAGEREFSARPALSGPSQPNPLPAGGGGVQRSPASSVLPLPTGASPLPLPTGERVGVRGQGELRQLSSRPPHPNPLPRKRGRGSSALAPLFPDPRSPTLFPAAGRGRPALDPRPLFPSPHRRFFLSLSPPGRGSG